jgi:hypothetical protein
MTSSARLLFVGGVARSGTTLVQNVLDSHPEIRGLPEFFMTGPMAMIRTHFHRLIEQGMITDICNRDDVDRSVRSFLEGFLLRDVQPGHRYVSEKTPANLFVFPTLLELFPEAKFILVIRDPRAVICSLLRVAEEARKLSRPLEPYLKSLRAAVAYVQGGHAVGWAAIDQAPGRVFTVKYEELVTDPVPVTRALCDYLELHWSEHMLRPGEFEHPGERPITLHPQFYDKERFRRNIEQTSLSTWKEELALHRQVRISEAFRGDRRLRELGYEMSLPHLSQPRRIAGSVVSSVRKVVGGARLYVLRALD